ncbi:MAG: cyclic-phosphate processing receiver domain-containing protein [Actinomycetota bacterium]
MRTRPVPHQQLPHDYPLTVLVDDVRDFKDQRPALVARSSSEALRLLDELDGKRIDDLWLDHDLIGDDTIAPVVDLLVYRAKTGSPLNVGQIHVHTANIGAGLKMDLVLRAAGYPVVRSYAISIWTRFF